MKKLILTLLASVCMFSLAACGDSSSESDSAKTNSTSQSQTEKGSSESISGKSQSAADTSSEQDSNAPESSAADSDPSKPDASSNKDTIVIYFSATGTTKGVAQRIADAANADTYEIIPQKKYTDADLDWNDKNSRTTIEMNDPDARPKIAGDLPDLSAYKCVFIGYPIWWGDAPRIMSTFVESVKLDGKTVIPFCTSGGSPIGRSGENLKKLSGSGEWLAGEKLSSGISEDEVKSWIDSLK